MTDTEHTLVQEFPILYGTEKNGKTKVWIAKIYLKGKHTSALALASAQIHAFATIEHGQLDGKKQLTIREYTEGKNIGKKNETTPLQQCIAETKRKWTDKHEKESYQETTPDQVTQTQTQTQTQEPSTQEHEPTKKYFPMLAHTFEPATATAKKNNITFPCFTQPKLDGLRCIMYRDPVTNALHCQSRTGSYFDTMEHVKASLAPIFTKYPTIVFDGELYTTEIPFEELAGLIKKKKLTPNDKERLRAIQYHIYDIVDETKPFEERHAMIRKIFAQNAASRMASPHAHATASDHMPQFICLVPTTEAKTPAEFRAQFGEFIEAGYEGIMLRNKKGMYRCNYRSHDLQKYKEFLEDEFPIVGFTQGDGRDKGTIIWICVTKEGKEFSVRPRGSMEHRRKLFETGEKYVGKKLTIIYQELTEEGKPRFPVGKDVRDKY
jgi:ATP-dependent DNA ligase